MVTCIKKRSKYQLNLLKEATFLVQYIAILYIFTPINMSIGSVGLLPSPPTLTWKTKKTLIHRELGKGSLSWMSEI
jgi:hypothetical protein